MAIGAGYAKVGKARRSMIDRGKKTNMWQNIIGDIGSAATFAAGQAKKSRTAWKDYESGYKELGGDVADIPKRGSFWERAGQTLMPGGDQGFFQKPEGEVRIGASMYDRSKIQEAGSFLGSDAAAVLDQPARDKYLQRTVPGRDLTTEEVSGVRKSLRPKMPFTEGEYDVDKEFGPLTTDSPVYQPAPPKSMKPQVWQNQEPGLSTVGQDWETPLPLGRSEPFQETEAGGYGVDPNPRGRGTGQWLRDFGRQYFTPGKGLAHDKAGELITDEQRWPGGYQPDEDPKERNAYNVWNRKYNQ